MLTSSHDRELFTAVSTEFVAWEEIARMIIDCVGSKSSVVLEDQGLQPAKGLCDVSHIEHAFGFRFVTRQRLQEHVAFLANHLP